MYREVRRDIIQRPEKRYIVTTTEEAGRFETFAQVDKGRNELCICVTGGSPLIANRDTEAEAMTVHDRYLGFTAYWP